MKTSSHTQDSGALQKGADFVSAFMLGFEVQDAVALLRLDDLYVESFQVCIQEGDSLCVACRLTYQLQQQLTYFLSPECR